MIDSVLCVESFFQLIATVPIPVHPQIINLFLNAKEYAAIIYYSKVLILQLFLNYFLQKSPEKFRTIS